MVDNHFWQEEEAVSGLRQADMDADDLAAIREMERQLQLEDAARLEAKYHTIEEPSNVLREQGNVETNGQRVLGDSQETPRTPQENRATDLEGRTTGAGEQPATGAAARETEITQPYGKSGEVTGGKSPDIHVEAPESVTINSDSGRLELNGKSLSKARKSDLQETIREGIAKGELPGRLKDHKLDVPEGKRRWIAEYLSLIHI